MVWTQPGGSQKHTSNADRRSHIRRQHLNKPVQVAVNRSVCITGLRQLIQRALDVANFLTPARRVGPSESRLTMFCTSGSHGWTTNSASSKGVQNIRILVSGCHSSTCMEFAIHKHRVARDQGIKARNGAYQQRTSHMVARQMYLVESLSGPLDCSNLLHAIWEDKHEKSAEVQTALACARPWCRALRCRWRTRFRRGASTDGRAVSGDARTDASNTRSVSSLCSEPQFKAMGQNIGITARGKRREQGGGPRDTRVIALSLV